MIKLPLNLIFSTVTKIFIIYKQKKLSNKISYNQSFVNLFTDIINRNPQILYLCC
jgi:hypothetical protein